jgi:hypothetical protein
MTADSRSYRKTRRHIPLCRDEIRQIERDVGRDVQAARSCEPSGDPRLSMPLTLIAQVKTASGLSAFIAPHTHRVSCNGGGAFSQRGTVTAPRGTRAAGHTSPACAGGPPSGASAGGPDKRRVAGKGQGYETEVPDKSYKWNLCPLRDRFAGNPAPKAPQAR